MSKVTTNFVHAFIAVVVGNALYFRLVAHLPWEAYHVPFHLDAGLLMDFCCCLAIFALIKTLDSRRKRSNSS